MEELAKLERCSRKSVFIGNYYSISPKRVIERFPELKSSTLKGNSHFSDFNLVPKVGWYCVSMDSNIG